MPDHRQGEARGHGGRAVAETQLQVGDHLRLARLERLDRGVVCCVAPVPAGKSHFLDRFWKTEIQSLVLIVLKGRREGCSCRLRLNVLFQVVVHLLLAT